MIFSYKTTEGCNIVLRITKQSNAVWSRGTPYLHPRDDRFRKALMHATIQTTTSPIPIRVVRALSRCQEHEETGNTKPQVQQLLLDSEQSIPIRTSFCQLAQALRCRSKSDSLVQIGIDCSLFNNNNCGTLVQRFGANEHVF